ncbi:1075_t:CDS:2, partial [Scutellospora calospora]
QSAKVLFLYERDLLLFKTDNKDKFKKIFDKFEYKIEKLEEAITNIEELLIAKKNFEEETLEEKIERNINTKNLIPKQQEEAYI